MISLVKPFLYMAAINGVCVQIARKNKLHENEMLHLLQKLNPERKEKTSVYGMERTLYDHPG